MKFFLFRKEREGGGELPKRKNPLRVCVCEMYEDLVIIFWFLSYIGTLFLRFVILAHLAREEKEREEKEQ